MGTQQKNNHLPTKIPHGPPCTFIDVAKRVAGVGLALSKL